MAQHLLFVDDAYHQRGSSRDGGKQPQYDPSASGMPTIITRDPVYMGWRTSPYNPVAVTVCPDSTVMLAAA